MLDRFGPRSITAVAGICGGGSWLLMYFALAQKWAIPYWGLMLICIGQGYFADVVDKGCLFTMVHNFGPQRGTGGSE
jgi:hypothetical protein